MISLAVDPGLICGVAVVACEDRSRVRVLHADTVRTKPQMNIDDRLRQIALRIEAAIDRHRPHVVVSENLAHVHVGARRAGRFNASNAYGPEVIGITLCLAFKARIPFVRVEPKAAKRAVGMGGNAEKSEVKAAVVRLTGYPAPQLSYDSADAVCLAIAGDRRQRLREVGAT